MRTALLAAFDLIVNAIGSFWIATLVVAVATSALRVGPGRAARMLWSIPFVKTLWDAAHGIPANAYFWARIEGTRQELGSFFAGAGVHYVIPNVRLALESLTDRGRMPSTIADLVATFLSRRVSPLAPMVIAASVIAVSLARLALRVTRIIAGERAIHQLRSDAQRLEDRRAGERVVEVFVSRGHRGAPFTGGLVRPYVCFPEATYDALSTAEREAAMAHEIAHVSRRDLIVATALDVVGDLLWFVPGVRFVRRLVDASTEHLADAHAVRAGAPPEHLASALVRVCEAFASEREVVASALVRPRSDLARRVAALLGHAPSARLGFERPWVAALWIAWLAAIAFSSSLAGHS